MAYAFRGHDLELVGQVDHRRYWCQRSCYSGSHVELSGASARMGIGAVVCPGDDRGVGRVRVLLPVSLRAASYELRVLSKRTRVCSKLAARSSQLRVQRQWNLTSSPSFCSRLCWARSCSCSFPRRTRTPSVGSPTFLPSPGS